ncbi:MAG TPA: histidinol-phosphatase [Afifellaceae bacterium]|nr:histidinol-phosphatase [Afifellaceae bacterium]
MQNLHTYVPFLHELAETAAANTRPLFRSRQAIENKAEGGTDDGIGDGLNPVTAADRKAEAAMRRLIGRRYPGHGILGEEYGAENLDAEWVWVLDPIDGTRGFICGIPLWGTLIGLRHEGEPVLGMISQPILNERFFGSADGSTYWSGGVESPLRTRSCETIAAAHVSTTDPRLFTAEERPRYDRIENKAKLARYGYDCYAHAMVALGQIDCIIEAGVAAHDIEPIAPILAGAGGCVTNWSGGSVKGGGQIVTSGDARLHAMILETLADPQDH